jgi:hypothetical protein
VRVADDDAAQLQGPAGAGGESLGLLQEEFRHAAADGAAADQADAERFAHSDSLLGEVTASQGGF